jgi:hypothetical protein
MFAKVTDATVSAAAAALLSFWMVFQMNLHLIGQVMNINFSS